jgi:hypothetical protein
LAYVCEHDNESACSIVGGNFIDQFNNYKLLRNDSTAWTYLVTANNICKVPVIVRYFAVCQLADRTKGC